MGKSNDGGQAVSVTLKNLNQGILSAIRIPPKPITTRRAIVAEIKTEQALAASRELIERFEKKIQATLARGHYNLFAYVVMPNHVHVLFQPIVPLARITRGIKGVSARDANATLGRVGKPFWQDEAFDHWIRDGAGFERTLHYIENNPVKAGLAKRPEDWPWSSAK